MKTLSILGIVISAVSLLCLIGFATDADWIAAVGWGIIGTAYLMGLSIVTLIKCVKK